MNLNYSAEFPEHVNKIAVEYLSAYNNSHNVREHHKKNMKCFDELSSHAPVFKQIANCIDALLWIQNQHDANY